MESKGLEFESVFTVDQGITDSESEDNNELESVAKKKDFVNTKLKPEIMCKKISDQQSERMFSFMDGRPDFTKGKMKCTEKTKKLLEDWEELVKELNLMGPPSHNTSEWRKIWTNIKANKKRRTKTPSQDSQQSDLLLSNPTGVIGIVTGEPEPSNVEKLLLEISTKMDENEKQQSLMNKALSDKLDFVAEKIDNLIETIGNKFSVV